MALILTGEAELLDMIVKCPKKGEEWPITAYTSTVNVNVKVITHNDITWVCPTGHEFTLKRAVEKGMFTPNQALKMISHAQENLPAMKKEIRKTLREFRKKRR